MSSCYYSSMIKLRLNQYLEKHQLSAYRLVKETKGKVARGSVYALARGDMQRVDLITLNSVMDALESLTGEAPSFDDLLERIEAGEEEILEAGLVDLNNAITEIEQDLSADELNNWLLSFGVSN